MFAISAQNDYFPHGTLCKHCTCLNPHPRVCPITSVPPKGSKSNLMSTLIIKSFYIQIISLLVTAALSSWTDFVPNRICVPVARNAIADCVCLSTHETFPAVWPSYGASTVKCMHRLKYFTSNSASEQMELIWTMVWCQTDTEWIINASSLPENVAENILYSCFMWRYHWSVWLSLKWA